MSSTALRHVFISYSRADSDFADKLAQDLEARGIGVWIDREDLHPGTSNWDAAVREAIDTSFAIVFVVSPNSARSNPVLGELRIASASKKAIFPVWMVGEDWSSCAPVDIISMQYIDLRNQQYDTHFPELIDAIEQRRPAHFILAGENEPLGYFKVGLGEFGDHAFIAFKHKAFSSMRDFTDALYTNYLRDSLPPFTYGNMWVLASDARWEQKYLEMRRLCMPFLWLLMPKDQRNQPLVENVSDWADGSLASFDVHENTAWQVMRRPEVIFGIVTNESHSASLIQSLAGKDISIPLSKLIPDILSHGNWQVPSTAHSAYQYTYVCSYDKNKRAYNGKVLVPKIRKLHAGYAPN